LHSIEVVDLVTASARKAGQGGVWQG